MMGSYIKSIDKAVCLPSPTPTDESLPVCLVCLVVF